MTDGGLGAALNTRPHALQQSGGFHGDLIIDQNVVALGLHPADRSEIPPPAGERLDTEAEAGGHDGAEEEAVEGEGERGDDRH